MHVIEKRCFTSTILYFTDAFEVIGDKHSFLSYPLYSISIQLLSTHSHCFILLNGVML